MRRSILGVAAVAGLAAVVCAGTAKADPYKYCAVYASGYAGGGTNCGFVTLDQCRVTISGIGGTCTLNPYYDGVPFDGGRPVRHKRRHRG